MSTTDPFAAQFDRELAELVANQPAPRRLPPDLDQLFLQVRRVATVRKLYDPAAPPHMFDRFETFNVFTGGMGMVLEGYDPQLDRKVAIKLWKQAGPEACAALLAEAKTLAKLSHRNIVTIYEPGSWGERVYFVMEWIAGMDGHTWIATKPDWQEIRVVFMAAANGLAAAHEAAIQHCDFKPANMLIGDDGRVVVADFGVADSRGGTMSYMAPERLRGERGDARSDQFSFCVSLWEALFRVRPFAGARPEQLLAAIEAAELRVSEYASEVPEWLIAVIRRGLAHNPDERWANMRELMLALAHIPDEVDAAIDVAPPVVEAARASGQWRGFLLGVASTTVAFSIAWALIERRERPAATTSPTVADTPELRTAGFEVGAVIETIEAGELDHAFSLWMAEYERRIDASEPERVDIDALAIGYAFEEYAELAASEGRLEQAKVAAHMASDCARTAAWELEEHREPTDLADGLIERAEAIEAELRRE